MTYFKPNFRLLVLIIFLVPLGFGIKSYHGYGFNWVNNSLSGLIYVIFWCLVVFFLFPRIAPFKIAGVVFGVTSLLEIMQLWQAPLLRALRRSFLGRTLLGTTFVWTDFIYYLIGCLIAWKLMTILQPKKTVKQFTRTAK